MSEKIFKICQFVVPDDNQRQMLFDSIGQYPVGIISEIPQDLSIPTMIIGWSYVKNIYPTLNILDKEISYNLCWTFDSKEMKKVHQQDIEQFLSDSIKSWLPNNHQLFDPIMSNVSPMDFISDNLNQSVPTFVYFDKGALYINNGNNNYIVNIKSMSIISSSFRAELSSLLNSIRNLTAFSFRNISDYIDLDTINYIATIENLRWIKYGVQTGDNYFNIIPGYDVSKSVPYLMSRLNPIILDSLEQEYAMRMIVRDKVTAWMSTREIAISDKAEINSAKIKSRKDYNLITVEYSNKRTKTGRITAHDNYNPQNLPKIGEERKQIISRFDNGRIVSFDYTSFEARISMFLSGDNKFIDKYRLSDLHHETATILYNREDVSDDERDVAKNVNHALLYGAGEETLIDILSTFDNPDDKIYQIRQFLSPLMTKSREMMKEFKDRGYIVNKWNSIIRTDKVHASFNNYIQSTASEIIVDKTLEIRKLLNGHRRSQFLFQVHDSIVLDLHPEEMDLIDEIKRTLSTCGDMTLTLSIKAGRSYGELEPIEKR